MIGKEDTQLLENEEDTGSAMGERTCGQLGEVFTEENTRNVFQSLLHRHAFSYDLKAQLTNIFNCIYLRKVKGLRQKETNLKLHYYYQKGV